MTSVFWFSRLKPGADAQAYERWVLETDYRLAQRVPCIEHYRVHRLIGAMGDEGRPPYDYIEILEVSDLDDYRDALGRDPALQQIVSEIAQFIEGVGGAWGETLAPLGKEP
jgi:hypothetical protein